jgi:hypothetical protein
MFEWLLIFLRWLLVSEEMVDVAAGISVEDR